MASFNIISKDGLKLTLIPYKGWHFVNEDGTCIKDPLTLTAEGSLSIVHEYPKHSHGHILYNLLNSEGEKILSKDVRHITYHTEGYYYIEDNNEDARLTMAKQYIKDNIETNLKLTEVAAYCYIGTKQLTRLFRQYENTTPAMYIQKERINKIIELMNTPLSLSEISEKMNFSSEYHFNSFFKKMESQPPGEYRRMLK